MVRSYDLFNVTLMVFNIGIFLFMVNLGKFVHMARFYSFCNVILMEIMAVDEFRNKFP